MEIISSGNKLCDTNLQKNTNNSKNHIIPFESTINFSIPFSVKWPYIKTFLIPHFILKHIQNYMERTLFQFAWGKKSKKYFHFQMGNTRENGNSLKMREGFVLNQHHKARSSHWRKYVSKFPLSIYVAQEKDFRLAWWQEIKLENIKKNWKSVNFALHSSQPFHSRNSSYLLKNWMT